MTKQPYTYTVLRYVHDTGTGEFANVGVVLTSPAARYADAILRPTYGRLSKMFPGMQPQSIKDKAHNWLGRMTSIRDAAEEFRVYYLVGEPQLEGSRKAFDQALNVLHKTPVSHEIVREHEAESFAANMADKIAAHDAEVKKKD